MKITKNQKTEKSQLVTAMLLRKAADSQTPFENCDVMPIKIGVCIGNKRNPQNPPPDQFEKTNIDMVNLKIW